MATIYARLVVTPIVCLFLTLPFLPALQTPPPAKQAEVVRVRSGDGSKGGSGSEGEPLLLQQGKGKEDV